VREVDRRALVPYSAEQMYALVDDIPSYPRFLPWCRAAAVLSRSDKEAVATLQVHKGALHARFTTRNRLQPPGSIGLALVSGPFRSLEREWRFEPIGDQGSRVRLRLKFAFANPLNAWLLEPVFEHTSRSLVDAFVARGRDVYGTRAATAL
jgi:ribosome-associated toxin RatA of RatAB toxin-antitoxin module